MHTKAGTEAPAASTAQPPAGCPMHSDNAKRGPAFNVYGEVINPDNNMPSNPNQLPAPGQAKALPTARQSSTIPKGGADGTWSYPSEQMFYNAMVRKGKGHGVQEDDVAAVVAIHNAMNERTWHLVCQWEAKHGDSHGPEGPKLRRFTGMPYALSPKARLRSWLGGGEPFDRHDWFVDRGDQQVRYIIDYYYNPAAAAELEEAERRGEPADVAQAAHQPIYIDARPALDSPGAALDRLAAFPGRLAAALRRGWFKAEGMGGGSMPTKTAAALNMGAGTAAAPRGETGMSITAALQDIDTRCAKHLQALEQAADEDARRKHFMALTHCMANVVCPTEANEFLRVLQGTASAGTAGQAGGAEEAAFTAMQRCTGERLSRMSDSGRA